MQCNGDVLAQSPYSLHETIMFFLSSVVTLYVRIRTAHDLGVWEDLYTQEEVTGDLLGGTLECGSAALPGSQCLSHPRVNSFPCMSYIVTWVFTGVHLSLLTPPVAQGLQRSW